MSTPSEFHSFFFAVDGVPTFPASHSKVPPFRLAIRWRWLLEVGAPDIETERRPTDVSEHRPGGDKRSWVLLWVKPW